jgi:hypothetical protein
MKQRFHLLTMLFVLTVDAGASECEHTRQFCEAVARQDMFTSNLNFTRCTGFTNFTQIEPRCIRAENGRSFIELLPARPLILDTTLRLAEFDQLHIGPQRATVVRLRDVLGFDATLFRNSTETYDDLILQVTKSQLQFYLHNEPITNCSDSHPSLSPLAGLAHLDFDDNSDFDRPLCAWLFRNVRMSTFEISFSANVFSSRQVRFDTSVFLSDLNCRIEMVTVSALGLNINEALLSPNVFANTSSMALGSSVRSMQTDIFKSFRLLRALEFALNNYRAFFHTIGMDWAAYVNYFGQSTPESELVFDSPAATYVRFSESASNQYEFADEDFCIFERFPFGRQVFPLVDVHVKECTCTLVYLVRFSLSQSSDMYRKKRKKRQEITLEYRNYTAYDVCKAASEQFVDSCLRSVTQRK